MARKKPTLPSVDDVLRDRVTATVAQLFALIHAVNPTARDVSDRDRRERYATKSRLLSLLIARHLDDVDIELDPSDPDVIGVRRRAGAGDLVHAKVPELDDEARARVRRRLDEGEDAPAPSLARSPAAGTPRAPPLDDYAAAEAALEAYDFDEAELALRRAFARDNGDRRSARALLELLVDHLGATTRLWRSPARSQRTRAAPGPCAPCWRSRRRASVRTISRAAGCPSTIPAPTRSASGAPT